jgi:hypothetical protein
VVDSNDEPDEPDEPNDDPDDDTIALPLVIINGPINVPLIVTKLGFISSATLGKNKSS